MKSWQLFHYGNFRFKNVLRCNLTEHFESNYETTKRTARSCSVLTYPDSTEIEIVVLIVD